ncbi:MAG: acetate--CoA ligase family protein [Chloroflexi bacterium]|nr:acetate--CoA ligase family protein [Chloroflexota bacterium]
MTDNSLTPFFQPRGVVIVGASSSPIKLGYGVARNLVNSGYDGAIHFVSQKTGNLFGRPVYTSLAEVPDPVDLAVLIVPAPGVADALRDCAARGIHAAVIVSSGFREAGADGARLEAECLQIARAHGIRLIGPNCIGLLDTHLPLDTTFLPPPMPQSGDVAFISQSGAICAAIIDWARGQGFGFSRLISLGNQADVNETDMLAAVAEDEHTRVLTLYLEGVSDGQRFIEEAARVARRKPVIALKVGRYASGQRAAASHTGALAGQDAAYAAAFEKAGIFRAGTSEEMFDWASALASCPLPRGRRMAVLTNAGGPGVIAADALERSGLSLAELTPQTHAALASRLPPVAGLHNPVDMLASASPETYAACLRLLLDDPNVDGVLVILPPPPMFSAESVADSLIPLIHASPKPVVVALMGEQLIQKAAGSLRAARVPEYRFPERAASALAVLADRAEFLRSTYSVGKSEQAPVLREAPLVGMLDIDHPAAQAALAGAKPGRFLDPEPATRLLAAYGIPTAPVKLARSEAEAAEIAAGLGFPVVLKVASPDIPHKSDVGGVLLNVQTPEKAAAGFRTVTARALRARPDAKIEGVHLQRMLPDGQEVIVGARRDDQFGALMMFGSGGVEVEGLKDVAFALAPLTAADAENMLRRTWAGRKLAGFRNISPADAEAVKEVLMRLARLAHDLPEIAEIEINPLRVLTKGVVAVDVRVKM